MAIERELKFRLAPRAAARAVRELRLGPRVALSSVYFDNAARELSRARAALRLRRVGRTWLQAFKCERTAGSRGEWETAVTRGALELDRLPCEEIRRASGIDLARIGGRLRPLFETRFNRRAADIRFDDATIELALDSGAVVAGRKREPILELEMELKAGAPRRLLRYAHTLIEPLGLRLSLASKSERGYRLALGEPATPRRWRPPHLVGATPHEALAKLASAAFDQIVANTEGMMGSDDPEYLHQLRVGLRRWRAVLRAFRDLEPRSGALRRRLRAIGPTLGHARDWDVLAQKLQTLAPQARRARAAARALVGAPGFQETLLYMLRWIEEAPWHTSEESLAVFAARALERLQRKVLKKLDWDDPGERHRLRIRVKRLRYAADAFAGCFPRAAASRYLAALERLQDDFGELNDLAVARRLAPALAHEGREKRLIARARRDWQEFEKRSAFWRAGR